MRPSRRYGIALVAIITLQAFASFADQNRDQILQTGRLLVYALLVTGLAVGAYLLLARRFLRDEPERLGIVVAVVVASFLGFGVLFDPDPAERSRLVLALLVWAILTVVVARLAYLAGGNANVRLGVMIFAVLMLAMPTISYTAYALDEPPLEPVEDPGEMATPAVRPNVYWLVLDSYARPDVMEEVVGVDPDPFVSSLQDDDFVVSSASRTSYWRTHLSLASTLEMDYVVEPGNDVTDEYGVFGPMVVGHNRTMARFRALGYRTVYGASGGLEWSACREDLVDVCLPLVRPRFSAGELEQALLDRTPLGTLSLPTAHSTPTSFVDGLAEAAPTLTEPFFAFQHVLSPHWPFRYRDDCSARDVPVDDRRLSPNERHEEYRTQVRCVTAETEEAVARILKDDPTAIIVIQSDHGSEVQFRWSAPPSDWTPAQIHERYGAFNAMRLPEPCRDDVEGAPLVNTFRIVFACIEGEAPELLDYRAFAHPIDDLSVIEEIDPDDVGG